MVGRMYVVVMLSDELRVATEKKPSPPPKQSISIGNMRDVARSHTCIHRVARARSVALRLVHLVTCSRKLIAAEAFGPHKCHGGLPHVLAVDRAKSSRLVDVSPIALQ